jgi:hypothetical protein
MAEFNSHDRQPPKPLAKQLDRWAGELNAFLMVLAVGLAVLDFTCFTALHINTTGLAVPGAQSLVMSRAAHGAPIAR